MKARFFALMALVLGLASCQTDMVDGVKVDANGEAAVTIQVGLPQEATRAAGNNSGIGAIGNLDLENDWDIRYILEVYDANGTLAKERMVNRESENTSTSFALRLVPGRDYKFVVWADFIPQSQVGNGDYHYNTSSLAKVTLSDDSCQHPMDESRDAYTEAVVIKEFDAKSTVDLTLTRPFAKMRVVTTDMNELYSKLTYVTVHYTTDIYTAFDAINEKVVEDSLAAEVRKDANYKNQDFIYADEANSKDGKMTLYADYFFGAKDGKIHFTMDVKDETGFEIPQAVFNTDIPVQRNFLTTIQGPILTDPNNITVTIDSTFAGYEDVDVVDVYDAADLQEAIDDASNGVETHIVLGDDINLNDLLTRAADPSLMIPAGKVIALDLNGKKLSATSSQTGKNYNMFDIRGTFSVYNGIIECEHEGQNMGWNNSTNVFNITAGGIVNLDGVVAKNLGGSDMAFVAHLNNWGEATLNVENSTLEATYIAVRAFNSGNDMNNISIYNSTLKGKFCFWVHNYKAAGDAVGTDDTLNVDICNGTNTFEYTGKAPILYGFDNPIYYNENGAELYYDAASLAAALTANNKNIVVTLGADIELPISSLGQQTGGSGEYKLGGEDTENITIDLNGKKLTIGTTYWSVLGAKNADALFTIKNGAMTSSQTSGTWNSYDLCFTNCNYAFEGVAFEKAIALESAGKSFDLKNVTINETHDYYAMWISAKGQTVTVNGLTVVSAGRGIKIDEQYVSAPAKVTLNVINATFTTAKKAAIVVKSVAGAEINVENIDIANVAEDSAFAVWVDEDSAAYADLVVVNGAYVLVEGTDVVRISTAEELNKLNKTNAYVVLCADIDFQGAAMTKPIELWKDSTFDGMGHKISNVATAVQGGYATSLFRGDANSGNKVVKNLVIENITTPAGYSYAAAVWSDLQGANIEIDNVHISGATIAANGTIGGFVGFVSAGTTSVVIKNSSINNSNLNGGEADHKRGAVVGRAYGCVVNCENVVVENVKINDVAATETTLVGDKGYTGTVTVK